MNEIKSYRKTQGWTQKNMAQYLEIPLITYVQWENGTRTPPNYVLSLIKYKLKNDTRQIKIEKITYEKEEVEKLEKIIECRMNEAINTIGSMNRGIEGWLAEYIIKKGYKIL